MSNELILSEQLPELKRLAAVVLDGLSEQEKFSEMTYLQSACDGKSPTYQLAVLLTFVEIYRPDLVPANLAKWEPS